ncbi:hypothetical protein [Microvirus mar19]|uniref:Uncharacterized protein n=1 Tax=Microvirus mar19 TaxID=2851151 RepID=A0A8F5RBZ6_9VIRU|nr:hypothetical protein [Microvirus mar19]
MAKRKVELFVGDKSMTVKGISVAQSCYDAVFLLADAMDISYDKLPPLSIIVTTVYGGND